MSDLLAVDVEANDNMRPVGPWQERLAESCKQAGYHEPIYNLISDRRGGRTAWSATVIVYGQTYAARYWYDGSFLANAAEDAAEVAWRKVFGKPGTWAPALVEQCCEKHDNLTLTDSASFDVENQGGMWYRRSQGGFMLLILALVLIVVAAGLGISLHVGSLKLNGLPTWM